LSGGSCCELTNIFKFVSLNPIVADVSLLALIVTTSYTLPEGRANLNPGWIVYALYTSGLDAGYGVAPACCTISN